MKKLFHRNTHNSRQFSKGLLLVFGWYLLSGWIILTHQVHHHVHVADMHENHQGCEHQKTNEASESDCEIPGIEEHASHGHCFFCGLTWYSPAPMDLPAVSSKWVLPKVQRASLLSVVAQTSASVACSGRAPPIVC